MAKFYITPVNAEIIFFLCSFYTFFRIIECIDVLRPRGVSVAKASLYAPNKDFTCLDGSATIPFGQVNDDYCDCFDGSDEPGTAACSNGFFHCTNAGHRPENIISSRVNDGVCDCCDTSDEYAHPTSNCVNNCDELGKEARLEAQKRVELLKSGAVLRSELIRKGQTIRNEMRKRLKLLENDRTDAEQNKLTKESMKNEIEALENVALKQYREIEEQQRAAKEAEEQEQSKKEAINMFAKYDTNQDGVLQINELQSRISFDRNHDGEVSEEEAKYYLAEKDALNIDEFTEIAWPIIKPALMLEEGIFKPPIRSEADDMIDDATEDGADNAEDEDSSNDHEDVDDVEDGEYREDHDADAEGDAEDIVDDAPPPSNEYDDETQRLVNEATDLRKLYAEAEKAVREIDNEISDIKQSLEKDFGPNDEYASLANDCLEYTDREYLYKLCPFDRASQQPKNGGVETRLGTWGEWAGSEDNKYGSMLYTQGTSCWNGPNRSARINIQCGMETQVISVSEPNRCEYVFDMLTPAACIETSSNQYHTDHDEL